MSAAGAGGRAGADSGAIYRSDDAGESWTKATDDPRPATRIDEAVPNVHPKDPDTLIVTNIVTWKSTDGGTTYVPFKGAPGGDDYQGAWINPDNPDIMLLSADQGAVVTLNGGRTWSSWYNQPTAQFYHVMTDTAFPYRIWAGSDDGLIHTTSDGGLHWTDVTPPQVGPFWKIFMIDPGRFDPLTAYAALNTLRIDDMRPHIFRTHDGGRSWREIVTGLPDGAVVSTVREDPKRKGLLFAGTETQVYVSFDDGDHWQSLRLNMAPSSSGVTRATTRWRRCWTRPQARRCRSTGIVRHRGSRPRPGCTASPGTSTTSRCRPLAPEGGEAFR